MERLKTFLIYALIIVAFFIFSRFLEKGLIWQMYYEITGNVNNKLEYNGENIELEVKVTDARATRVNGYIDITVTNTSKTKIDEAYIKVKLYTKSNVYATQKYMEINDLKPGESKKYKLRFKGSYIERYVVTLEKDYPDKDYIFNFFGYEINTKNIFGLDLSNVIKSRSIGEFFRNTFHSIGIAVKSVPWWAYVWAVTIIVGVW